MDAKLTDIYQNLYRGFRENSLRAPESWLDEINRTLDAADNEIGRDGWSLRYDARLFLAINFAYVVAAPLASRLDDAELRELVSSDIRQLIRWAVDARREKDVDRLLTSHAILEAAQRHWNQLATTAHWFKPQG